MSKPRKWIVSPYNFEKEVMSKLDFPQGKKVFVVDSTIRKIQEMPVAKFSKDDAVDVAAKLDEAGVAEMELNMFPPFLPEKKEEANEFIKTIDKQGFKFKMNLVIPAWSDEWKNYIERCMAAGADFIELVIPSSDIAQQGRFLDWKKANERMCEALDFGEDRGAAMFVGYSDVGRSNLSRLIDSCNKSIEHGSKKLLLYETYGSLVYDGTKYLYGKVREDLIDKVPIIAHIHNPFGTAVSHTLAAVTAGAHPDVAMNGLGVFGGLASLEEVVVALETLYGVSTGIKMEKIYELSKLVAEKTGLKQYRFKPIVGEDSFVHLYGFVEDTIASVLRHPEKILDYWLGGPFHPSMVGQKTSYVWTKLMLNGSALRARLDKMGVEYTDEDVNKILGLIKKRLEKINTFPCWITEAEVEQICKQVLSR